MAINPLTTALNSIEEICQIKWKAGTLAPSIIFAGQLLIRILSPIEIKFHIAILMEIALWKILMVVVGSQPKPLTWNIPMLVFRIRILAALIWGNNLKPQKANNYQTSKNSLKNYSKECQISFKEKRRENKVKILFFHRVMVKTAPKCCHKLPKITRKIFWNKTV